MVSIIIIIIAYQTARTVAVKYRISAKDLVACDRQSVGAPSEPKRALTAVKTSIVGPIRSRFGAVALSVCPYALNGRQKRRPNSDIYDGTLLAKQFL
jgi:hypothetical protein